MSPFDRLKCSFRHVYRHEKSAADAFLDQSCQELALETTDWIEKAKELMMTLENYHGCLALIQQSIQSPHDPIVYEQVMTVLEPNVDSIKALYDLAKDAEYLVVELLLLFQRKQLAKLQSNRLLEKLMELLELTLCLDLLKTKQPAIQNDLSYYRRLVAIAASRNNQQVERFRTTPLSTLSLFVANHFPMLSVLIAAVESANHKDPSVHQVLASIANRCVLNLPSHRLRDPHLVLATLRTMTSAILLYDHTSAHGVFLSQDLKIKQCLRELSRSRHSTPAQELMQAIRYASRHYHSATDKLRLMIEQDG